MIRFDNWTYCGCILVDFILFWFILFDSIRIIQCVIQSVYLQNKLGTLYHISWTVFAFALTLMALTMDILHFVLNLSEPWLTEKLYSRFLYNPFSGFLITGFSIIKKSNLWQEPYSYKKIEPACTITITLFIHKSLLDLIFMDKK